MPSAPWTPSDTFGARLRLERDRLGYGLARLADAAEAFGVIPSPWDRTHVQHWHTRRHGPRADALAYLARLGLDVCYLITGARANEATRLAPHEGLGLRRWPDPWASNRPVIEWSALETAAVCALRRAHAPHAPPAWAAERVAALTIAARHFATDVEDTEPPAHRVEAFAATWLAHFAAPHGNASRIAALSIIECQSVRAPMQTHGTRHAA
jgi:transcriptional regulator with XRE-family HTH domain